MNTFNLPDLGEGLQEAEIVAWHVEVGDDVVTDQPLLSVETDKAVVEIPAPQDGCVKMLHGQPGDMVETGGPLVDFEGTELSDSGVIVGELNTNAETIDEDKATEAQSKNVSVKATPAVRALARKLDVDLSVIAPSGPNNTVTVADVERVAKILSEAGPSEPLAGVRRAMARKMAQSHAEVVPATVNDQADIDAWGDDQQPTLRLIRAIVAACEASPALNAWYDGRETSRRLVNAVHLGIAVHNDDGLFVPVLRDVGNRSPDEWRKGMEAMKVDLANRSIPPEELRGATITLSNYGVFGAGKFAQLVVVPPQVAIVGAGRIFQEAVADGDKIVMHRMLPVSLTFDHRAVNGGEAAHFLAGLIADLEKAD